MFFTPTAFVLYLTLSLTAFTCAKEITVLAVTMVFLWTFIYLKTKNWHKLIFLINMELITRKEEINI